MDILSLDICFYTDGDFAWNLAPIEMTYNSNHQCYDLHIVREAKNEVEKKRVIDEFSRILEQLTDNVYSSRDWVLDYVKEILNKPIVSGWKKSFCYELSGNYEGSYIKFNVYTPKDKVHFQVSCTREELEKINERYGNFFDMDSQRIVEKLLED